MMGSNRWDEREGEPKFYVTQGVNNPQPRTFRFKDLLLPAIIGLVFGVAAPVIWLLVVGDVL